MKSLKLTPYDNSFLLDLSAEVLGGSEVYDRFSPKNRIRDSSYIVLIEFKYHLL